MDFLDLIDKVEGDVRNTRNIFSSEDGVPASRFRKGTNPVVYKQTLTEAIKFLADVKRGRKHYSLLREAMTTDDFPLYFGDILDRSLMARYELWPADWEAFARRVEVNDFRDAKVIPPLYGADGPLDIVPQGDQYPDAALYEQEPILWSVQKYGRKVPISWETLINDDLNFFTDIPDRLARAARRTEHRLVADLFIGASGPNTTLYTSGHKNIVTTANGSVAGNNPALSINGLQSAYIVLTKMTDETGEPIYRDMVTLVVPPALEVTAKNMLSATTIWDSSLLGGGQPDNGTTSGERRLQVDNWMRNKVRLVVDPYIPILASSANGNTSWFLFADPNSSREAIRIGFLRGHTSPEIWMKSPNAIRMGGGNVGALEGDFDTDSIEYRVRHVTGVTQVDYKATVMSNGSGS